MQFMEKNNDNLRTYHGLTPEIEGARAVGLSPFEHY